jgi:adenylyltransferase/sulfurtransferase
MRAELRQQIEARIETLPDAFRTVFMLRGVEELSVEELRARLDAGDIHLVDVREPFEVEICRIPGAVLIPLGQLGERMSEVPRDRDVAVHCKSGGRSAKAVKMLQDAGWTRVRNVKGGILAWAEIDPSVKRY